MNSPSFQKEVAVPDGTMGRIMDAVPPRTTDCEEDCEHARAVSEMSDVCGDAGRRKREREREGGREREKKREQQEEEKKKRPAAAECLT